MAQTFVAQLQRFADMTSDKIEAVVKQSAQDVFSEAQTPKAQGGNIPVDTGFLWNDSFYAELNGGGRTYGSGAYVMTIAGMELGDSVFGGWSAEYALHVEYGTSRMAGSFFALRAAQQWPQIVAANAQKARNL